MTGLYYPVCPHRVGCGNAYLCNGLLDPPLLRVGRHLCLLTHRPWLWLGRWLEALGLQDGGRGLEALGLQEGRWRVQRVVMTNMIHSLDILLLCIKRWRLDQRLLFGCQLLNQLFSLPVGRFYMMDNCSLLQWFECRGWCGLGLRAWPRLRHCRMAGLGSGAGGKWGGCRGAGDHQGLGGAGGANWLFGTLDPGYLLGLVDLVGVVVNRYSSELELRY